MDEYLMIRVILGVFSAVFFWGSAFVGITLALEGYSPEVLALGRALIASFIAALLYKRQATPLCPRVRLKAMGLGVVGIGLYSLLLNIGEKTVPAGVAGFVVGQLSLLACILACIFLREKISLRLWIGIGVSIVGLFLMMLGGGETSFGIGLLFVIGSTLCGAIYTCFQKPVLKRLSTRTFICHAIWGGTLFLVFYSLLTPASLLREFQQASIKSTLSLIYLGCCPSVVAYLGWSYALSKVNIAKVGIYFYAMPVVGGLLAWALLSEVPTKLGLLGMGCTLLGSLIGTLNLKRKIRLTKLQNSPS